jgi:hypothetical protein
MQDATVMMLWSSVGSCTVRWQSVWPTMCTLHKHKFNDVHSAQAQIQRCALYTNTQIQLCALYTNSTMCTLTDSTTCTLQKRKFNDVHSTQIQRLALCRSTNSTICTLHKFNDVHSAQAQIQRCALCTSTNSTICTLHKFNDVHSAEAQIQLCALCTKTIFFSKNPTYFGLVYVLSAPCIVIIIIIHNKPTKCTFSILIF